MDILLSEKLELAKASGIKAEVSLLLPKVCEIDDLDLCIIFANALDNALKACQSIEGTSSISITGKPQGDLYLLEFYNTCSEKSLPQMGIGLSNIKSVAEKYHGAMLIETHDKKFSLNVLLNISLPADNSSRQMTGRRNFWNGMCVLPRKQKRCTCSPAFSAVEIASEA